MVTNTNNQTKCLTTLSIFSPKPFRWIAVCLALTAIPWTQSLHAQSIRRSTWEPERTNSSDERVRSERNTLLRERIDRAIDATSRRYLTTQDHDPWQIVHGIKAFGWQLELEDKQSGRMINAIEFLCSDRPGGRRVFVPAEQGLKVQSGPGLEGHPNQFLSAIAQAGTPLDFPISVDSRTYSLQDVLNQAKYDYRPGQESSWTLIAFSTYLYPDETWSNRRGETFRIEDLVAAEVAVEPTRAACGGTHNLYALAYALNRHREDGGSVTGVWRSAADKLAEYYRLTQKLQNNDGYFSANFYASAGHSNDPTTQLNSTGHTMEWLTVYLSPHELDADWVTRAIEALVRSFERTAAQPVECGSLYHATRALVQYRSRVFDVPSRQLAHLERNTDDVRPQH